MGFNVVLSEELTRLTYTRVLAPRSLRFPFDSRWREVMRILVVTLLTITTCTAALADVQTITCPAPTGSEGPFERRTIIIRDPLGPSSGLRGRVRVMGWRTTSAERRTMRLIVEAE